MMTTRLMLIVALAAGCSEPLLKNAPRPPSSQVAGVAAAAAAAVTLADPDAAARKGERAEREGVPPPRTRAVHETIPADVLDRLDRAHDDDRTDTSNVPATPRP
jgi:hypothetical protein